MSWECSVTTWGNHIVNNMILVGLSQCGSDEWQNSREINHFYVRIGRAWESTVLVYILLDCKKSFHFSLYYFYLDLWADSTTSIHTSPIAHNLHNWNELQQKTLPSVIILQIFGCQNLCSGTQILVASKFAHEIQEKINRAHSTLMPAILLMCKNSCGQAWTLAFVHFT